jgi:hypothetical protein
MHIQNTSGFCVTYDRRDGGGHCDWVEEWTVFDEDNLSIYIANSHSGAVEFVLKRLGLLS